MVIPFLYTMGLCALMHVSNGYSTQMNAFIPQEERVLIQSLSNGVKTYVQENEEPAHCGSFRVVMRKAASDEVLYAYDGSLDALDQIELFFDQCKKTQVSDLLSFPMEYAQEIAVVAVGDFPKTEMLDLIEKHFNGVELAKGAIHPIQIDSNASLSKVAMRISFPNERREILTYSDLKESWKFWMLQELYQQRLQRCLNTMEEAWIHPHPQFLYPVSGYSLVSEEIFENLLSYLFWQIEAIRNEGYSEEEFETTKSRLVNQLQYLSSRSALADHAFLASYYADQFISGDRCPSYESFLSASAQFVEEMQSEELLGAVSSFLDEDKRLVHLVYPQYVQDQGLNEAQIEQMIEDVASLSTFYRDSELPEESFWMLDTQNGLAPASDSILKIQNLNEQAQFQLAENIPIMTIADNGSVESYYQLPLNDKERKTIRTIFTTMAEKNIIQLALEKRTMEKKGKKIHHVHPLRFIGYLMSTPDLKACMKKIHKSSFKWDAFVDGFSKRMKEEYANNNLYRHIPGFCKEVGANPDQVTHFIERKDWEGLARSLL